MRVFMAIASGFVLTLAVFAGGAVTAVSFLSAKPVEEGPSGTDTTKLWTSEAVQVNAAAQDFERLPAQVVPENPDAKLAATASRDGEAVSAAGTIDMIATGALPEDALSAAQADGPEMDAAHLEWCFARYRSYDPHDNSYNSYSGGRRECVSPYSDAGAAHAGGYGESSGGAWSSLVSSAYAGEGPADHVSEQHMRDCFSRYRSYRPEDNSYQPYGGGPRQQCL